MPSWVWVLAALLAFGALQLLALRVALRGEGSERGGRAAVPAAADGDPFDGVADDARQCPQCGAENRPGYSYCRNCVTPLLG